MGARRLPGARLLRGVLVGLAGLHLLEAMLLRHRARQLKLLREADEDPQAPSHGAEDVELLLAPEVNPSSSQAGPSDPSVKKAVAQEMVISDTGVVDLVPEDLPALRALALLRRVSLGQLEDDPLYSPGGAHQAVAIAPEVVERIAKRPPAHRASGDRDNPSGPAAEMVRQTVTAQRYAPFGKTQRVAPQIHAGPWGPQERWDELEELNAWARPHARLAPIAVGLGTAHLLAMTAGLVLAPAAAAVALATWSAQPYLVFGGRPGGWRPPKLSQASTTRLVTAWRDNLGMAKAALARGRWLRAHPASSVVPHSEPPPDDVMFEPRRSSCPWCGSDLLRGRLDTTDLINLKPGRFHLDECVECGHIFQNPALSLKGLAYHYEHAYDGINEEATEWGFAGMAPAYDWRLDAVTRYHEPRAWLDVGGGHGHFCLVARHRRPGVRFDVLDMSDVVDEAERRGWADVAYQGLFPELASSFAGAYDVVSMSHYLEHTRDPVAELDAAAKALEAGGILMIEVPDPAAPRHGLLGRWWLPWFQPQHQHIAPCENLVAAVKGAGFDVLSVQRGEATMGGELSLAVALMFANLLPSPELPWRPPPPPGYGILRTAAGVVVAPVGLMAFAFDRIRDNWQRRPGAGRIGNAYRIVARRI